MSELIGEVKFSSEKKNPAIEFSAIPEERSESSAPALNLLLSVELELAEGESSSQSSLLNPTDEVEQLRQYLERSLEHANGINKMFSQDMISWRIKSIRSNLTDAASPPMPPTRQVLLVNKKKRRR